MRSSVVTLKQLESEKREAVDAAADELELELGRPRKRADCVDGPRPCPYVSCKFHLYLDVETDRWGRPRIHLNFPDLEPWELTETCVLDVAERMGLRGVRLNHEGIGRRMNLSHEGVRKLELRAFARIAHEPTRALLELLDEEPEAPPAKPKRRLPIIR